MQEQTQEIMEAPAKPKLPAALIAVIAIVGLLGIGGLITAYVLMHNNYSGYLDQLKAMVATTADKYEKGEPAGNATLEDQYYYYVSLNDEVANLSATLEKLNAKFPLLPGRADDKSIGIYELKAKMADTYAKLATLKQCIDEDAAVSQKLTELLAADAATDISLDMSALSSRNSALDSSLSGISFTGPLEAGRAQLASAVKKRGDALKYLAEDADVQGKLTKLLADTATLPADIIAQFGELKTANEALTGKVAPIEIQGVSLTEADLTARITARKTTIETYIQYFTELKTVQSGVAEFCQNLKDKPVTGTKYAERLAGYMGHLAKLKTLEDQVKAINDKKEYAALPVKRTAADLGMTEEGKAFIKYEAGLAALNDAVTKSGAMEKKIDALLKDTKMTLPNKISALLDLIDINNAIVKTPLDGVPEDLTQGFSSFLDGCRERVTFLNEFMAYVDCKVKADGYKALQSSYSAKRTSYLQSAAFYESKGDSYNANHFKQLASDQSSLASAANKGYNNCLAEANTHKAAYEASRKKYQAMLAK